MMGLDTTHDCWHGAYSAFSRWRNEVALAAGYMVEKVTWKDMGYPIDSIMLEWHRYEQKNFDGIWDQTPDDILIVLFVHSDCDGEILPEHANLLAERLEGLLPKLSDEGGGHIARNGGFKKATEKFIDGLREAHKAGESVEFH